MVWDRDRVPGESYQKQESHANDKRTHDVTRLDTRDHEKVPPKSLIRFRETGPLRKFGPFREIGPC